MLVASGNVSTEKTGMVKAKKWVEYKKIPVMNNQDSLPYPNCYIIIKQDSFFYYRYKKLYEKQLLIRNKNYIDTVYTFKQKPGDLLLFNGVNNKYCLLKRDYFEGDYEYFKLSE